MGLESLNESETGLLNAISKAGLDDFVAELPDGLNSNVGERGSKMSGGERQRMGIARALYSMPKTLIFDEATSSLDNLTQEKFTSTLKRISRGRTVVIVAHRLNTVVHCNKILFLDDGKVAGYSSFDELMTSNSKFVELVNLGKM
jgi:ABC-type multidrug transport system fused ATPase/permease subunit